MLLSLVMIVYNIINIINYSLLLYNQILFHFNILIDSVIFCNEFDNVIIMNPFNCCLFKYVESIKNYLYIIFLHSLGNCFK